MILRREERRQLARDLCGRMVSEHVERFNVQTVKRYLQRRVPGGGSRTCRPPARDAEAVPALADTLVTGFRELLADESVDVHDYSAVAEIPV